MTFPSELPRDYLLTVLTEECAEVIQAITKCQRFGFDFYKEDYGLNRDVLAQEVGDALGVIDALLPFLDGRIIEQARSQKIARVLRWKKIKENIDAK